MAQYRKKPVVIEAITFDELMEHGREHCGPHLYTCKPDIFEATYEPAGELVGV